MIGNPVAAVTSSSPIHTVFVASRLRMMAGSSSEIAPVTLANVLSPGLPGPRLKRATAVAALVAICTVLTGIA